MQYCVSFHCILYRGFTGAGYLPTNVPPPQHPAMATLLARAHGQSQQQSVVGPDPHSVVPPAHNNNHSKKAAEFEHHIPQVIHYYHRFYE